ncbi:TraX family protein [Aureibacillus halotolerans]|uniref:TraX protein n=1 Tax=Aureibacillus halotolerans TaxID=1508390 RepID=A0A4R6UHP1_9BACI|nr:TraX family protein [Aureibacillus halotolerans]TDQ42664.1 TraX protein [Aureibacillus halotolerans]
MNLNQIKLNSNALKLIAIVTMVIDHTSIWLVAPGTTMDMITHTIGRMAAPIMCYLIAEGYCYTSNIHRYMKRLFIFSLISHFPFVLFLGLSWWQGTSVIWTLLMGLVALYISQRSRLPLFIRIVLILLCCLFAWTADWNYIGVLWVLFFGLFRGRIHLQLLSFVLIGTVLYLIPGINTMGFDSIFRFGILLVVPLLLLYNGQKGKKSKLIQWSFYVFYPLHLFLLYILSHVVFG